MRSKGGGGGAACWSVLGPINAVICPPFSTSWSNVWCYFKRPADKITRSGVLVPLLAWRACTRLKVIKFAVALKAVSETSSQASLCLIKMILCLQPGTLFYMRGKERVVLNW